MCKKFFSQDFCDCCLPFFCPLSEHSKCFIIIHFKFQSSECLRGNKRVKLSLIIIVHPSQGFVEMSNLSATSIVGGLDVLKAELERL